MINFYQNDIPLERQVAFLKSENERLEGEVRDLKHQLRNAEITYQAKFTTLKLFFAQYDTLSFKKLESVIDYLLNKEGDD